MTDREPVPSLPKCPECLSSDRVERLDDAPKHDPYAVFVCRCGLNFTGSALELHRHQARKSARLAERVASEEIRAAGAAAGVLHGDGRDGEGS